MIKPVKYQAFCDSCAKPLCEQEFRHETDAQIWLYDTPEMAKCRQVTGQHLCQDCIRARIDRLAEIYPKPEPDPVAAILVESDSVDEWAQAITATVARHKRWGRENNA